MKKQTICALLIFVGLFIAYAILEGTGSNSAEIDQAQQESVLKAYQLSETTQTAQE